MPSLFYPPVPVPVLPLPTAAGVSEIVETSGEMLPVIEPNGEVIGQASREYCHKAHLLHPVIHLHLIDRFGNLFLQKRALSKENWPGCWDTAVGGHVLFGESFEEALYRESDEELGLTAFNPILVGESLYKDRFEHELVAVYAAVGHFPVSPNPEEVSEGRWWRMDEIEDNLGKSVFTPIFEEDFRKLRPSLEALL